jgi:hypothetical protein
MRVCPVCRAQYQNEKFCPEDGTPTTETQHMRAPITMLTERRVEKLNTTQPISLENFKSSVRFGVEADYEKDPAQANEKRCAEALKLAQTMHQALLRRLKKAATPNNQQRWKALLQAKSTKPSRGQPKLMLYLKEKKPPSLSFIGGWFSLSDPLQPPELTEELRLSLGVPVNLGDNLLIAGDIRNVLAHREEYESEPQESLGNASTRLQSQITGDHRRIIVPVETINWMENLCIRILEQQIDELMCMECMRTYPAGTKLCSSDGKDLYPASKDPLLGRTIEGFYKIERGLGYGGMGRVYAARRVSDGHLFALKILRRDLANKPDMVQRFQREAQAAMSVNHPNCTKIFNSGQTRGGLSYFAMEYLDGQDLSLLLQHGALEIKRAIHITRQICAGLGAVHQKGMIHRDIKPSNIMLINHEGAPDFVKILDFGIAKLQQSDGGFSTTATGIIQGTPEYVSPEQARGEKLDGRSDIYSLGVLLYQLVTGQLPFTEVEPAKLLLRHIQATPPNPRALCPTLPSPLEYIILHAMEKDREQRFRDTHEMNKELEKCYRAL